MDKRKSVLKIGVVFILFMLVMLPLVNSARVDYSNRCTLQHSLQRELHAFPFDIDDVREDMELIFELYSDEIELIMDHFNDNGCGDGGVSLPLPAELQGIIDAIQIEIMAVADAYYQIYQDNVDVIYQIEYMDYCRQYGQTQSTPAPLGGGITTAHGPYQYIDFCDLGFYWEVWLDHNVTYSLSYGSLLSILLGALGPAGVIIAVIISGEILYIQSADQGNGVIFDARISLNPLLPRFYAANVQSQ